MNTQTKIFIMFYCFLLLFPMISIACPPPACPACYGGYPCTPICDLDYCCGGACRSCCDNSHCGHCEGCSSYTCIDAHGVSYITPSNDYVCAGEQLSFTATSCPNVSFPSEQPTWTATDGTFPSGDTGETVVWKAPSGTSGYATITASYNGRSGDATVQVIGELTVVEHTTQSTGPIYPGCPGTSVTVEAKLDPSGFTFPEGWPKWELGEGHHNPAASLSNTTGTSTTLTGITIKPATYRIWCKAFADDPGLHYIEIVFNLINELPYGAYDVEYGECPASCGTPCDGEDGYELDDCGNELEFSCCDSGGGGGVLCAFRVFYNNTLLSSCIFGWSPENYLYRRIADIQGTDLKVFTRIKHVNMCNAKYLDSCLGYYCTKFYFNDLVTGSTNTYWRRDPDAPPETLEDGTDDCPGHE